MISVAPSITNAGKDLITRALGGEEITFTRFKIGNGEMSGTDISEMTDLINPLVEFSITAIDKSQSGFVQITGTFDNTYITNDFRWRELGVFCKGEDNVEVMYAYANDGDNAGLLKADQSDVVAEETVSLIIAIGDAENVTAIIAESVLYASKADFDVHVADQTNPHNVTKAQVGLGNVPNVTTNDQTPTYSVPQYEEELESGEPLSTAFGKIAKSVKSFIDHMLNISNPHEVTVDQIDAARREHTHTAADVNSGILGVSRGGTGVSSLSALKHALGTPNIIIGTYTGNGTMMDDVQVISFAKDVQAIIICCQNMYIGGSTRQTYNFGMAINGFNLNRASGYGYQQIDDIIAISGKNVSVMRNNLIDMNASGETYMYIALTN